MKLTCNYRECLSINTHLYSIVTFKREADRFFFFLTSIKLLFVAQQYKMIYDTKPKSMDGYRVKPIILHPFFIYFNETERICTSQVHSPFSKWARSPFFSFNAYTNTNKNGNIHDLAKKKKAASYTRFLLPAITISIFCTGRFLF